MADLQPQGMGSKSKCQVATGRRVSAPDAGHMSELLSEPWSTLGYFIVCHLVPSSEINVSTSHECAAWQESVAL